jgi:hypothetical protein
MHRQRRVPDGSEPRPRPGADLPGFGDWTALYPQARALRCEGAGDHPAAVHPP